MLEINRCLDIRMWLLVSFWDKMRSCKKGRSIRCRWPIPQLWPMGSSAQPTKIALCKGGLISDLRLHEVPTLLGEQALRYSEENEENFWKYSFMITKHKHNFNTKRVRSCRCQIQINRTTLRAKLLDKYHILLYFNEIKVDNNEL